MVCFNKDEDFFFWFSSFILSFFYFLFFYLMKVYLFHLDVVSPDGFILHVDYYQWRLQEFCLGGSLQNFYKKRT